MLLAALTLAIPAKAQDTSVAPACITASADLERVAADGWTAFRESRLDDAERAFRSVLARCGTHASALVGAGYVALRGGELPAATGFFERALVVQPRNYDALTGLGMIAWRTGDHATSRRWFEQALVVVPGDSLSEWYLARLPALLDSAALPERPRPASTVVAARAGRRILEVPDGRGGWSPLWVKAVNIGAALPGKHPSEFPPDDGTYERWIELVAGMNANAVRVYTIHPPHFYRALARWNAAHPERPLWLIHGVWTELPPGPQEERYDDPTWNAAFRAEMRRVVDIVHGRALIPHRPGHASGLYVDDLSRWTLAYIIGREWEPYSVVAFARQHPARAAFHGRYLSLDGGNAVDAWLAEVSEAMIAYEMERYNTQRPLAYTNWPTLDPLVHPTETTLAEEDSIRRVRKEVVPEMPKEFDNDAIGLDASLVRASREYPAGVFASFHAYPYYPDFMVYDADYARATSPEGPSHYFGYLRTLVDYFGDMPVLISEYGVPSSRGIAHMQPQGWHHGGHSEVHQGEINARLTRDIHASGAAGAGLFALIDEWFKKNWLVIDFEMPLERNRLWLNALDAEQHYGVIAMRPGHPDSVIVIDGARDDWKGRDPWYRADSSPHLPPALRLRSLSVAHDEAYVYLRLETGAIDWTTARYLIGIDTHDARLGDGRLPYTRTRSPVGLEFVIDLRGPTDSRVLVDEPYNLYRALPIKGSKPPATQRVYNRPFRSARNADGRYDSLLVVTNRRRFGRDGTVYPAIVYERNRLLHARQQDNSLADWYADTTTGVIEIRIPWGMLHVLDPSSRLVLHGHARSGEIAGIGTDGFRFVVQSYDPREPAAHGDQLPRGAAPQTFGEVPLWRWEPWEAPRWYAELKPQYEMMRQAFGAIPNAAAPPPHSEARNNRATGRRVP